MTVPRSMGTRQPSLAFLATVALFALAVISGGFGCGGRKDPKGASEREATVIVSPEDVVLVEQRRLESGGTFTGELSPAEIVEVVARFDGDLEKVLVREGQAVKKGQALAIYMPRDVQDARQAAEAAYSAAQAQLAAARNGERRARRLLEAGAASPSDLEAAEAALRAAESQVSAAEAQRNVAADNSERLDVPSPIAGMVSRVNVHSGDRTAIGDRMIQIVDTSTLELSATVPSQAIAKVQVGTPITFTVEGYEGRVFHGVVDRVNPTTEPGTRQVQVYTRIPNEDGTLVGGLFASGRLVDRVEENALAAPVAALRKEGTADVIYRVRSGRAERIAVEIGLVDEAAGVVGLSGRVQAGDSLLTGVLPGLRDGVRVRIARQSR
jgi:RND family efflux transporter MFP subunit